MPYPPPQQPHRFAPQTHLSGGGVGSNCCGPPPSSVSGSVGAHQYRNYTNEFPSKRCPGQQQHQQQQQQRQCGSCDALTSPQTPLLPNPEWYPTHNSHPNGIYACSSDCSDHSLKSHLHGTGRNNCASGGSRGKRAPHHHTHNGKGQHGHHGFAPSLSSSELKGCCNGGGVVGGAELRLTMEGCDISGGNNSSSSSSNNNCSSNNSSINTKNSRMNRSASGGACNGSEECDEDSQQQQLVKQSSLSKHPHSHSHPHHNLNGKSQLPGSNNNTNNMYNHYEECGGGDAECCSMSRDATEEDEECEDDTCCSCSESSCLYAEAVEPVHQAQIIRVGHN